MAGIMVNEPKEVPIFPPIIFPKPPIVFTNTEPKSSAIIQPTKIPITPPKSPINNVSERKIPKTVRFFVPMAFKIPISRVRSMIDTIMIFMMPTPATSNEIPPIPPRKIEIVEKIELMVFKMDVEVVTTTL